MRSWHIIIACVAMGVASAKDRWVWGSTNPEEKARRIPGYVPTTPEPPITTFRPSLPLEVARGSITPSVFQNGLPPFFPGFLPFDFVPSDVPRINDDGTTKSRIVADTATLDTSSGASLTANDKYTTLDRLQRERGPTPAFPPPKRHQLGGLHPDEVFYADDDLLIIRGGGFNSDAFQEPSQPLDEDGEEDIDESIRVTSSLPPPSSNQEYNGNIPSILPPPEEPSPFSIFVGGSSRKDYILVPFVEKQPLGHGKPGSGVETLTHNRLSGNEGQTSSKLRRAASSVIPSYAYQTPANTMFLHQAQRRPAQAPQRMVVQHQVVPHFQPAIHPVVHQHRLVQQRIVFPQQTVPHPQNVVSQPAVHREPLGHHQSVSQQRPVVANHYQVPRRPVVQNHPVVLPASVKEYPELELQTETPRVVHSFVGDTDVNFLPPLPRRNPEAEVIQPVRHRQTYVHTHQQHQRPRV